MKTKNLTSVFKALSDENRLKILDFVLKRKALCNCENCTCLKDVAKKLDIGMPTISHHVKELAQVGLLKVSKSGQCSYLEVEPKNFSLISDFLKQFTLNV